MNTKYKNFTKLERYIDALKGEYYQEYPEFTLEQIRRPIYLIANWVDLDVNKARSEKLKMLDIGIYREILRDREEIEEDGRELEQSMLGVLCFLTKAEDVIRYDVSECCKIRFPEESKEKYLEFISKMTETVVSDMCDTLEKRISYAGKIEYLRWIEQEPEENKSQIPQESFVERVSGTRRSNILSSEDPQSFSTKNKRRKVTSTDDETEISKNTLIR